MKTFINLFKDIARYYYNKRNGVQLLSESDFNRLVDKTKPIHIINI